MEIVALMLVGSVLMLGVIFILNIMSDAINYFKQGDYLMSLAGFSFVITLCCIAILFSYAVFLESGV